MNGIDAPRDPGTATRRWLRTGGLAVAGSVLLSGALLGVAAQPASANTVTCGGLTETAAKNPATRPTTTPSPRSR